MSLRSTAICTFGITAALMLTGPLSTPGQAQAHRVLRHESEHDESFNYEGGLFLPVWQGGALLGVEGNLSDEPIIFRVDKDGQMERIGFSSPGGRYITLMGLAAGRDGSIATIGAASDNEGRPCTFLARITPDRSRKTLIQLWPYVALTVTFLPDGGMWTVGYVKPPDNLGISEYNVLKRFDASGKLLASTTVRALGIRAGGLDAAHDSFMNQSKDRIGWLTNANEYIEFALDGHELGRFEPPPGPAPDAFETSIAMNDDNEVLVGTRDGDGMKVWSLDREDRSWRPVALSGGKLTKWAILGFDADKVVVIDHRRITGATVARYSLSSGK